jgi:chromosome segregation ATPase
LKTEEGERTEAQKVVETLLKKIETISAEASLLEKELAKTKEENRQLVAGLEKERKGYSAKEEALASAMEMEKAKRQAAEDMVKVLKSQVDSVEKKMMELNQELAENIRKLGERQEQERFVMLAAFLVAAVSFSVALVISIAARRKPPSEES